MSANRNIEDRKEIQVQLWN